VTSEIGVVGDPCSDIGELRRRTPTGPGEIGANGARMSFFGRGYSRHNLVNTIRSGGRAGERADPPNVSEIGAILDPALMRA
jgi:hypothetical protein